MQGCQRQVLVKQAANVVELLEFFAERKRPATLAEIADSLGWPRSSTFNLVATLSAKGYLYEPKARGGYYPSRSWGRVAQIIDQAEPLPEAVELAAQEVADATGETACIAAPAGVSALLIYAVESRQPIRFSPWLGERNPIQASASGRALLSTYAPETRRSLYRKIRFERYTPQTLTGVEDIEAAVLAGAARGYHVSAAEVVDDLIAIAAPLHVNDRVLALLVAGPMSRCAARADSIGELLRAAAARCSAQVGASGATA
jgi:DNA-binding IclR family transcriptional regulator